MTQVYYITESYLGASSDSMRLKGYFLYAKGPKKLIARSYADYESLPKYAKDFIQTHARELHDSCTVQGITTITYIYKGAWT